MKNLIKSSLFVAVAVSIAATMSACDQKPAGTGSPSPATTPAASPK
jgi:hypothetical protein